MGWLNSDDSINPKALRFVAEYFATHPEADVIYGNRIIIDENDQEIGRWLMPPHDDRVLDWIDYVPQETLFWRKRAWDRAGGIDPTFQFALDWDFARSASALPDSGSSGFLISLAVSAFTPTKKRASISIPSAATK